MITIGVDAHKRIQVALALDEAGRLARERLFAAVTAARVIDASVLGALRTAAPGLRPGYCGARPSPLKPPWLGHYAEHARQ